MNDDVLVRCKNWQDEPDVCGETCGVPITLGEANSVGWVGVVLDTSPEWFVVLRSCSEHGRHLDPYCSLVCFTRYHANHEHADDAVLVPTESEGRGF